jgi:hypothetical protein
VGQDLPREKRRLAMSGGVIDLTLGYFRRGGSGIAWMLKKTRIDNPLTVLPNRSWLGRHNILRLSMELAAESGQVMKCLDTRKEEIAPALNGGESGQALYLSSDWSLRNSYVVGAVLSADHRIAFVA